MKSYKIIFLMFLLSFFTQVGFNADNYIQFIPETGDYKISFYQENGDLFVTIFEPATKVDPFVHSVVSFNTNVNSYVYHYELTNSVSSKQRLRVFSVEHYTPVTDIMSPSSSWRARYFRFAPILDWANSRGESGLRHPKDGIAPDSSQSGFGFESKGLPTIVTCYFRGGISKTFTFTENAPIEVEEFLQTHGKFPANTVQRKTLGPKAPPFPFFPAAFLDTLVSYTRQSGGLGWIADQQTSEKYETRFHSAQTALQEDRLDDTRQTLYQVLQEVQTDSGAALTSEAYALLCYNTVYLLSQLQESEVSLDDLIAYIRQAFEEGKITNKGIANSLIAKLETAGKHLEKGKPKQAVNVLNAFLNELEAQHEKHIAGEVYDYLKENVTALITRLGSPE